MSSPPSLPFVSVILPVHNAEATVGAALRSLVEQDYPRDRYEIIAVDNRSRDRSAEIMKNFPEVKVLSEDRVESSYAARNRGVRSARGGILAFIDADCIASPSWIREGVKGFAPGVGCVAGGIEGGEPSNEVEEYLNQKKELSQTQTLESEEGFPPYPKTANAFYDKRVFDRIGEFEGRWLSAGDADLAWRMQFETDLKVAYVPTALIYHRHRSSEKAMFRQCVTWGIGYTNLYKKYPARMRRRTFKQTVWIGLMICRRTFEAAAFHYLSPQQRSKARLFRHYDHLSFLGWELGRIIGSLRNRVFYV